MANGFKPKIIKIVVIFGVLGSNWLLISILLICYHQHFGGCTGYGHDEAGGRGALDQAFAEIFGAESSFFITISAE